MADALAADLSSFTWAAPFVDLAAFFAGATFFAVVAFFTAVAFFTGFAFGDFADFFTIVARN
jgi:hypothetical protein